MQQRIGGQGVLAALAMRPLALAWLCGLAVAAPPNTSWATIPVGCTHRHSPPPLRLARPILLRAGSR